MPDKAFDRVVCRTANTLFDAVQFFNKYNPSPSFIPQWSDKPLLKSWQKTKPQLGWPRETDSLCPGCVKEARGAILSGRTEWRNLQSDKIGEIKARIVGRGRGRKGRGSNYVQPALTDSFESTTRTSVNGWLEGIRG